MRPTTRPKLLPPCRILRDPERRVARRRPAPGVREDRRRARRSIGRQQRPAEGRNPLVAFQPAVRAPDQDGRARIGLVEVSGSDRQVQRRVVPAVLVAERRSGEVLVGAGHQRPRSPVDVLRAGWGRVPVDVHPVGKAGEDLGRPIAIEVGGLDRRVVLRLGPIRRRRLTRRRRRKRGERHGRPVGVHLRAPLAHARVEPPNLQALVIAPDQLVAAVPVDVGQLDRRVLRRIGPAVRVTPAREHERRPARVRIRRTRLRTTLRPGHARLHPQPRQHQPRHHQREHHAAHQHFHPNLPDSNMPQRSRLATSRAADIISQTGAAVNPWTQYHPGDIASSGPLLDESNQTYPPLRNADQAAAL